MGKINRTVVGIDVGGKSKGFHAVALWSGEFFDKTRRVDPQAIASWCRALGATVVAVDAPCRWSMSGHSRFAERCLARNGIRCFFTPTKQVARKKDFYKWMLNGERLYRCLESKGYRLFLGGSSRRQVSVETFPHAVTCAIIGTTPSLKRKAKVRRAALKNRGINTIGLPDIDYVDAALCALAAEAFRKGKTRRFGDRDEGYIVVPNFARVPDVSTYPRRASRLFALDQVDDDG